MVSSNIIVKAIEIIQGLNPKNYPGYFADFYQKHGLIKTAILMYVVAGLLYMFLKSHGLWFKKSVKGKHVFITGAGSGIGRQIACMLASKKANITVTDINQESAEETAKIITSKGGKAIAIKLDVTSIEDIHSAGEAARSIYGEVDILINNAGIAFGKKITELSKKMIDSVFMVNIISHFYTVKEFLPEMIKRNSGHIVTIASAGGTVGVPTSADYSASKFAAFGFDESLRNEMRKIGANIKTTCICPYYINTGMFKGARSKVPFVLPFTEEDWASKRIVNAILQEEAAVFFPFTINWNFLIRAILPISWFDFVHRILGTSSGMDDFIGRH